MNFSGNISKRVAMHCHDYDQDEQFVYGESTEVPPSILRDCEEFERFVGCEFDFHGAQDDSVRLNNCVYRFLADPDDGYRSHLGAVICSPAKSHTGYFQQPVSRIILISTSQEESWPPEWSPPPKGEYSDGPFHGYFFVDTDDYHIWCQIGTEYHDSYYPCFVARYNPKPPSST